MRNFIEPKIIMTRFSKLMAIATVALSASEVLATDYLVCDFEDCEIGQTFKVWNNFGDVNTTSAVVADYYTHKTHPTKSRV